MRGESSVARLGGCKTEDWALKCYPRSTGRQHTAAALGDSIVAWEWEVAAMRRGGGNRRAR